MNGKDPFGLEAELQAVKGSDPFGLEAELQKKSPNEIGSEDSLAGTNTSQSKSPSPSATPAEVLDVKSPYDLIQPRAKQSLERSGDMKRAGYNDLVANNPIYQNPENQKKLQEKLSTPMRYMESWVDFIEESAKHTAGDFKRLAETYKKPQPPAEKFRDLTIGNVKLGLDALITAGSITPVGLAFTSIVEMLKDAGVPEEGINTAMSLATTVAQEGAVIGNRLAIPPTDVENLEQYQKDLLAIGDLVLLGAALHTTGKGVGALKDAVTKVDRNTLKAVQTHPDNLNLARKEKEILDATDDIQKVGEDAKPIIAEKINQFEAEKQQIEQAKVQEELNKAHEETMSEVKSSLETEAQRPDISDVSKEALKQQAEQIKVPEMPESAKTMADELKIGDTVEMDVKPKVDVEQSFRENITPKQLRELLNEEGSATKTASGTGATKRLAGDYLYKQDRGAFDALLNDIKTGVNKESWQKLYELSKPAEARLKSEEITPLETEKPEIKEIPAAEKEISAVEPKKILEASKRLADKIRQGKIIKPDTFQTHTPASLIWDSALEVTAKTLEAGGSVAQAVADGLKVIRDSEWYKGLPNERKKAFDKSFEENLTSSESGVTLEESAKTRESLGMEEYKKQVLTHKEREAQAKKLMDEGYNINELLDKIKEGNERKAEDSYLPSPVEVEIMKQYKSSLEAKLEKEPSVENFEKIKEFTEISDPMKTRAGQTVESFKGLVEKEDNLANFIMDKQDAVGVKLTDAQVKTEIGKYDEYKKAREEYEKSLAEHQEKIQNLERENERLKAERKLKGNRASVRKSHEEYVNDRKIIIESAREDLRKLRTGELSAVPIAGVRELITITPHVAKLAKSLGAEGIGKLSDAVNYIHGEFKDLVDGLTKRDVEDILLGKYSEVKKSVNEVKSSLRDWKTELQLIRKLEDVRKGVEPKSESKQVERSKRIQELENKIKEVTKSKEGDASKWVSDGERLANKRKSLVEAIQRGEAELKSGIVTDKVQRPKLKLDHKTQLLQDRLIEIQRDRHREIAKDQYANRTKAERWYDVAMQVLGIRRVLNTAIDLSMVGRQAITLTANPRHWGILKKAFAAQLQSVFSPKQFRRLMFDIKNSPHYREMTNDKIHFNDMDAPDALKRNEDFQKSFLYHIPIVREPLLASQRAADALLNISRYELYMKGKDMLEKQGKTRENSPQAYKDMAEWTMDMTGRGKLLKFLEESRSGRLAANYTFFGARLFASRWRLLSSPFFHKMDRTVRINAFKDMASFTATTYATLLAFKAAGFDVSFNPDDSDFLQVTKGDRRWDITGGLAGYVRQFLRLSKAAYFRGKSVATGKKKDLKKADKYGTFAGKTSLQFLANKLSPNTGYAARGLTGDLLTYRDFEPEEILDVYPLYVDDVKKAWEEEGASSAITAVLLPQILGFGYVEYDKSDDKKK